MRILIDNGHGRNTAGKKSPYSLNRVLPSLDFEEWEFNRDIARRLVLKLQSLGYTAQQIVTEEFDISLAERVRRVNAQCHQFGKDNVIFISIHADASGSGAEWNSARGWSCYTSKGQTASDKLAESLYCAAERIFYGMKIRKQTIDGDCDIEENFYVLKYTLCPAVLTENFFYTNEQDCIFIRSEIGRAKIVDCHVDGILKFIQSL